MSHCKYIYFSKTQFYPNPFLWYIFIVKLYKSFYNSNKKKTMCNIIRIFSSLGSSPATSTKWKLLRSNSSCLFHESSRHCRSEVSSSVYIFKIRLFAFCMNSKVWNCYDWITFRWLRKWISLKSSLDISLTRQNLLAEDMQTHSWTNHRKFLRKFPELNLEDNPSDMPYASSFTFILPAVRSFSRSHGFHGCWLTHYLSPSPSVAWTFSWIC